MNPALWGGLCALSLGSADFVARYSSRALGHASALLGMLVVGAAVLTLWVWIGDPLLVWPAGGLWLLALNGVTTTIMMLLLYRALARGPVSIVAPIVASHPALVVALAFALGSRPIAIQWAAMAVTLAGALVIAGCARRFEEPGVTTRRDLRTTVMLSLGAALSYAVMVAAAQAAVPIYGALQTLWVGRLISLATIVLLFLVRGERPKLTGRWWPVIAVQGLLDSGGYLFLLLGSHGPSPEIAVVTGSTFGAVTTLLARFILREAIGLPQWGGIVLVFAGVAVLSLYG
ncbi:MAG: DMT family transporter [Alphaproteobacteria bacterium]